jgi:hypothetical protein
MLAGKGQIMSQLVRDGLRSRSIQDLQDVTLEELAGWAQDGDSPIQDIVRQMMDDGHGQQPVNETKFNSAIS